mmetsp:Transcript_44248/g.56669  ORF Transcript_44248/g.56669 Transcript_44248/m.56669 type:complete len:100 (-) Transcript_44248:165-464(-)
MSFTRSQGQNSRPSTQDGVNDRSLHLEPHIQVVKSQEHENTFGDEYDDNYDSGDSFDNGYATNIGGHGREIVSRRSTEYNVHDLSPIRVKSNRKSVKKN